MTDFIILDSATGTSKTSKSFCHISPINRYRKYLVACDVYSDANETEKQTAHLQTALLCWRSNEQPARAQIRTA
jgi:hypothetical protein